MSKKKAHIIKGSEVYQFIFLAIALFGFWLLMSGFFTIKHLIIGAATSIAVAWITRPLLLLPSAKNPEKAYLAFNLPYFKFISYYSWLIKEIVVTNIYMIKLVLSPKLLLEPMFVTFKKKMDNPVAHAVLGLSIVVTPGTVTIDIDDDVYLVHAIDRKLAEALVRPDGQEAEIARRVGALFDEKADTKPESKPERSHP